MHGRILSFFYFFRKSNGQERRFTHRRSGFPAGRIPLKKIVCAAAALVLAAFSVTALDRPFFNGYTGFSAGVHNSQDETHFKPECFGESFFTGQIDFGGRLFLRGGFYVYGDDIFKYDSISFEERNARFRMEECSATLKLSSAGASHYLNAYYGNFEPAGSDLFLQRQFGIKPVSSSFTDSYRGLAGISYYPMYAKGASYTFRPEGSFAFGISCYQNEASSGSTKKDALNLDVRIASLLGITAADFCAGLALPEDEDDDKYIFAVKEIQIHGGLTFLAGNKNTSSLLIKAGINALRLHKKEDDTEESTDKIDKWRDVYAFVEARAAGKYISIDTSGFFFPRETAQDMVFLRHTAETKDAECVFGGNVNIHSERLYIGTAKASLGAHTTLAVSRTPEKSFENSLLISPYAGIDIFGGTLNASVSVDLLDLRKRNDRAECYSAQIGFKVNF